MKYLKVTLISRSFDFLYDFRKKSGLSFWDVFNYRFGHKISKDYATEEISTMHHVFYLPYSKDVGELTEDVQRLIREMTESDDEEYILSVTDLQSEDVQHLQEEDIEGVTKKEWFSDAKETIAQSNDKKESPAKEETASEEESKLQAASTDAEVTKPEASTTPAKTAAPKESGKEDSAKCATLADEAERINSFRNNLLSEIRGQRHAVDEVVQTIFECDAFTGQDEERKGPLASFLFVGPSGVGKTLLAKKCEKYLGRKLLTVDMSTFSDNLANMKFNGEYNHPAIVTGFVRENPNGILLFDEIEKAHINTIHLFLQILEPGVLRDMKVNRDVSFRDTIIILTTNAGASLYDDTSVRNLSGVPRKVILEALRSDINPSTKEPFFPECITTRFANGHVVLFNHLEPYSLMEIIQDELRLQAKLFEKSFDVQVSYDERLLSALVLYTAGGVSDARTLRGIAKNILVKELQSVILQAHQKYGNQVNHLHSVDLSIDVNAAPTEVQTLFKRTDAMHVLTFADAFLTDCIQANLPENTQLQVFHDLDSAKRFARGVVDYILLDPACGMRKMDRMPDDIEDIDSDGIDLLEYLMTYYPETPIYVLDTRRRGEATFATLLARGVRGVVDLCPDNMDEFKDALERISLNVLINNRTYTLGRSGKVLRYNCSQYLLDDETVTVSFDRLALGVAPSSADRNEMVRRDENGVTFKDVIGCKKAKQALSELCRFAADPRQHLLQGRRIPKGILLYGPPGTGKTMLAKAMANEADVAFFPTTATSFFGSLVGESERNVREMFRKARKYAPSVLFIDEVDAIGRMRTGSSSSIHNEDTLNAFLAEMDGFAVDPRRPVIIIAATNYDVSGSSGRVLDPAFVRRFDQKILVDLPDADDREQFLRLAMQKHSVHFGEDHDAVIHNMAQRSSGMSNADLDSVVEMFLRSLSGREPSSAALMDALDAFRFGDINKIDPDELRRTSFHESGHALVSKLLGQTPAFLTIVSRGNYGGFMEHAEREGKIAFTFSELMDRVCCSLAGRAAEIEVFGREIGLNTGAQSDIEHARYYIRSALDQYAMGENLYRRNNVADGEEIMRAQFKRACELLSQNRTILDNLANLLLQRNSLDKTELEHFFNTELT